MRVFIKHIQVKNFLKNTQKSIQLSDFETQVKNRLKKGSKRSAFFTV